jgi:hypothetical protein
LLNLPSRSVLAKDEASERKLAIPSRAVLRKLLLLGISSLCAVLLYFSFVVQGLPRFFYLAFALVGMGSWVVRLRREQAIVAHLGKAVGTVLEHKRAHRRGARIKYGFLADDDKMYLGAVGGTVFLPEEGQTLGVAYNLKEPSTNLPLKSFWFYDFLP